jgi:NitT/TauT family transport system substrate-binding protein
MQGLPLRVVAYVNVGSFFLFSRPEIRTIADLKGKVIAQATVAGLQDYLLKAMLKANGLDPTRDVQYVSLGDDSLGLAAVKSGQVHAAIAQVPTPLIAEKEGLRIIGNTADFARFPTAAIGTSLERMKSRQQEVKEVIRGTLLGIRYITEHHEESAQILSRWQKVSLDVAQRTLELLRPSWVVNGFLSDEEIRAVIDERKASLKITREIAPADVVDYRFLKEAQKELGGSK